MLHRGRGTPCYTARTVPRRVLVIGLDCAPPALVFDRYREVMPHVSELMERGTWGPLRSCAPPITVPAWTCMVSGRDPGELGLYGFRNRERGSYGMRVATSRDVKVKRVWDWLGEQGRRVAALFVPLTWPPTPARGQVVSCFLTPGPESEWAFPRSLKASLVARHGEYLVDVPHFRADDRERILEGLYAMGRQHFAMARQVWNEQRPDFLMMVEMGPDRFHHAFWHFIDPSHPRYEPGNRWEASGREYYAFLDARIGELLEDAGEDTAVMIVSDHGARAMIGGVCVNEWLRREGWLTLREEPDGPASFDHGRVDWSRTRAWGEGGYYARIWLNVEGREPEGAIPPGRWEAERERLAAALEAMPGPDGRPLGNRVLRPEASYRETRGVPPDLMVFFGDLAWRSIGTVGGGVFTEVNDTGPDGCNHDWDGVFVAAGGGVPARGRTEGLAIYDVASTICALSGVPVPPDLLGTDRSR